MLIFRFNKISSLEDQDTPIHRVYLTLTNVFDRVPYHILLNEMVKCGLDDTSFRCTHSWLNDHTQITLIQFGWKY